jgi:hypothetical protein
MSRFSLKHRLETIETFGIPVKYKTKLGENGVNRIYHSGIYNDMKGSHHRLRERFTNRISNFLGFILFILKKTFIMSGE